MRFIAGDVALQGDRLVSSVVFSMRSTSLWSQYDREGATSKLALTRNMGIKRSAIAVLASPV